MELIWNEINAPRLILRSTEQTLPEGSIPPPEGKTVAELLDHTAEIVLDSCRTEAGRLNIEGRLIVKVLAADENGELFAFTSEAPITHSVPGEGIEPGMGCEVLPKLTLLDLRRAPDGRLMLSAAVDLDCAVISAAPLRTLSGVNGVADMEIKTSEPPLVLRKELGSALLRLSDELSCDGADTVIASFVQLSIRDTAFENGGVTVSGVAFVNALCRSADGELVQLNRSLPFRQNVETDGTADEVYASASLKSASVTALGTEFSLVALEAEADIRVFGLRPTAPRLPLDVFSPTMNFSCIKQKTSLLSVLGGANSQHSLRESVTVPDGMPDIFTAAYASCHPVVTDARIAGGELTVDGLLPTRLIYRSAGGTLFTFTEEVPFNLRLAAPAGAQIPLVSMNGSCTITGASGRNAQIAYSLDVHAEFWNPAENELIVGLAESEEIAERPASGLVIYTVSEGETVFDIAKRFRLPTASVRELNPDLGETVSAGDKVLLIV